MTSYPKDNCTVDYDENHKKIVKGSTVKDWSTTFHEYAVERSPSYIAFVHDGVTVVNATVDPDEVDAPLLWGMDFHLILNTAIGGTWPGEPTEGECDAE